MYDPYEYSVLRVSRRLELVLLCCYVHRRDVFVLVLVFWYEMIPRHVDNIHRRIHDTVLVYHRDGLGVPMNRYTASFIAGSRCMCGHVKDEGRCSTCRLFVIKWVSGLLSVHERKCHTPGNVAGVGWEWLLISFEIVEQGERKDSFADIAAPDQVRCIRLPSKWQGRI